MHRRPLRRKLLLVVGEGGSEKVKLLLVVMTLISHKLNVYWPRVTVEKPRRSGRGRGSDDEDWGGGRQACCTTMDSRSWKHTMLQATAHLSLEKDLLCLVYHKQSLSI